LSGGTIWYSSSKQIAKSDPVIDTHVQIPGRDAHVGMPRGIAHIGECPPAGQRVTQ